MNNQSEQLQNSTLEERVELLEIQVVVIQDEVSDLETNINFLFDEQVIQDERLLSLEQETDIIDTRLLIIDNELDIIDDQLEGTIEIIFIHSSIFKRSTVKWPHSVLTGLEDTTLALDF